MKHFTGHHDFVRPAYFLFKEIDNIPLKGNSVILILVLRAYLVNAHYTYIEKAFYILYAVSRLFPSDIADRTFPVR